MLRRHDPCARVSVSGPGGIATVSALKPRHEKTRRTLMTQAPVVKPVDTADLNSAASRNGACRFDSGPGHHADEHPGDHPDDASRDPGSAAPHPLHHAKKKPRSSGAETGCLEARAGVEPTYTDLQSGA